MAPGNSIAASPTLRRLNRERIGEIAELVMAGSAWSSTTYFPGCAPPQRGVEWATEQEPLVLRGQVKEMER
jgi:hypothetical protein